MTDAETLARLKAACERVARYGKDGPRPHYDPSAPSLPAPPADAPKPPQPFTERIPGEDDDT
jgi:hypothetical protein